MRIEIAIFTLLPDALRPLSHSVTQALAATIIRSALIDALWTKRQGEPRAGQRQHDRLEAIEFFAGHIDPASDEDVGWGEDDELLTLERWCDIADLDLDFIRKTALAKIHRRSPKHRELLHNLAKSLGQSVEYVE